MNHALDQVRHSIAHVLDEWADTTAMSASVQSDWLGMIRAVRAGFAMLRDNWRSTTRRIGRGFVQGYRLMRAGRNESVLRTLRRQAPLVGLCRRRVILA
jgi:hypothetical protein